MESSSGAVFILLEAAPFSAFTKNAQNMELGHEKMTLLTEKKSA